MSDKVLSQEEIDAMLGGSSSQAADATPAAAAPAAAPIEGVKPMEAAPSPAVPTAPAAPEAQLQQGQPAAVSQPATISQQASPAFTQPGPVQPPGPDLATQAMLNDMAAKMQNMEAAVERVVQLEKALYETNMAVRQLQQEFQSQTGQIQIVSSRLEGVLTNLKATLGYNAKKTFVCASCNAKGEVAAQIKCTRCNKKNWWGWWPSKWR